MTDIQARLDNKQHLKEIYENMKNKPETTHHPFTGTLTWKVWSHTALYLNKQWAT